MPQTTAHLLGLYQKGLLKAELDPEIVNEIVRHAAFMIHQGDCVGIVVEPEAAE